MIGNLNKDIRVCDEWENNFEAFYQWSIANGYADDLVIDKDIKHGGLTTVKIYSPQTCMWVTALENITEANKSRVKEVYQYDLESNFIHKYASQAEASRQTGLSQGNIGQVLKGNRKQTGGYKWKYQMNLES